MQHDITPVILAGGRGLRLRPLTGDNRPKPFLKLCGQTLLQNTMRRVSNFGAPVIVCDARFLKRAQSDAMQAGITPQMVVAEPCARNTAMAITLAAFYLRGRNTMMMIVPSDHYFSSFPQIKIADNDLYILGVSPRYPATRYGYIKTDGTGNLVRFIEKPDRKAARALLRGGNVFWNSGIFLVRPESFLESVHVTAPDVFNAAKQAFVQGREKNGVFFPDETAYQNAPSISVDYAVMEHVKQAKILPFCGQWHDVGCWPDYLRVRFLATKKGNR